MNPLIRLIPPFMVRLFASPYVAGDSLDKAVDTAAKLWTEKGRASTLDLLAEDIEDQEAADRNVETYFQMADALAAEARFGGVGLDRRDGPTISVKPSSYTIAPLEHGGDARGSADACLRICRHATERGIRSTIDMEGSPWTDFTLDLLDRLHAEGLDHVGAVLQTRLNRTQADLDRLPKGCRVRLVIGIYREDASIAVTDKVVMKERMLDYARKLLDRGHYVEFASHDERYVERFVGEVVPASGVGADRFEVQMLYGVPRDKTLDDLQASGITTRLYVPFALSWGMAIAYLRRRLDEAPGMMFLVARNMLRTR